MDSFDRFSKWHDNLPPYKHDIVLIGVKIGMLLVLFALSETTTRIGGYIGMPWGIPFFIISLILIGAQFYLIFAMITSSFRRIRS